MVKGDMVDELDGLGETRKRAFFKILHTDDSFSYSILTW